MIEATLARHGLPANPMAERTVLGVCLLGEAVGQISLTPDDFHVEANRKIWRAILRLWSDGTPVDYLTLAHELERTGDLANVGGAAFLTTLTDGVPRGLHVAHYAAIVRQRAMERRIVALASDVATGLLQGASAGDSLARLEHGIESVRRMGEAEAKSGPLLLPAHKFIAQAPERIEWLVEGLIERGAVGFISADPKVGKSWLAIDAAVALATGGDWLGLTVAHPYRVALISREDSQYLTAWRMRRLLAGRGYGTDDVDGAIWCNSRSQSPEFWLTDRQHMVEMTAELSLRRPDMVILDVFNKMHGAKENDSFEMGPVIRAVEKLSADLGAAVCVVHHNNKGEGQTLVNRMRGSSGIGGAAQWIVGLSWENEAQKIRRAEFLSKAAESPDPVNFRIESDPLAGTSRIELVDRELEPVRAPRRTATAILEDRWTRD